MAAELPIHFFTLVLNGEPFIRYHLERFKALGCPWHWHIIEGLAELKHDTAWSLQFGAQVPVDVARDGRSVDGTAEYLDQIARENPGNVTVYRAPGGRMWDGKLEMVNAPLANLPAECLLWEVDSDELWTTGQIERMRKMFLQQPQRTAAVFYCWYFVAPELVINRWRRYQEIEWRRAWRFKKGMRWLAHEPPVLGVAVPGTDKFADVTMQRPFVPAELEQAGLTFQHFAYVVPPQLEFKEKYYGYKGITEQWRQLQAQTRYPVPLKQFFNWPWVHPGAMVEPVAACGIVPLAHVDAEGKWQMQPRPLPRMAAGARAPRGVLFIRWGSGGEFDELRALASVQRLHPELPVHVETLGDSATVLDKARMFELSPFDETLYLDADTVVMDRLDFGFAMAQRHGLACAISDCPWARRYAGLADRGDLVDYDTGVIFFTAKAQPVFEAWKAVAGTFDSSYRLLNHQSQPVQVASKDQAAFSVALAESPRPPFVLPMNWNFRPRTQRTWWGPIKVWHDRAEPPAALATITEEQARAESIIRYLKFNG